MRRRVFLLFIILLVVCPFAVQASGQGAEADRWITQLKSADEHLRDEAIQKLVRIRSEASVHALADYMDYTFMDWRLKIEIMKFLGEMKHERAVRSLAVVLEDEMCPALKWNAARALGNFPGNPEALKALVSALPGEEEPQVREGIVLALGDLGDGQAVPVLVPLLNSESFALRNAAIRALGKIASADALPSLKRALQAEKDVQAQESLRAAIRNTEARTGRM